MNHEPRTSLLCNFINFHNSQLPCAPPKWLPIEDSSNHRINNIQRQHACIHLGWPQVLLLFRKLYLNGVYRDCLLTTCSAIGHGVQSIH